MKFTVLGSGTYQPIEADRQSSAHLLQVDDLNICLDFGRGAICQLLKLGILITKIDKIFISHWHPDHVADLLPILHYTTAPTPQEEASLVVRGKPLDIYGPKGTFKSVEHLMKATYLNNDEGYIKVWELSDKECVVFDNLRITAFETNHSQKMNCMCYRIEKNKMVIAYSGDSGVSDGLTAAISKADLAVVEGSMPPDFEDADGHLTIKTAAVAAENARVKKLALVHILPKYRKTGKVQENSEQYFSGEISAPDDLTVYEV